MVKYRYKKNKLMGNYSIQRKEGDGNWYHMYYVHSLDDAKHEVGLLSNREDQRTQTVRTQ